MYWSSTVYLLMANGTVSASVAESRRRRVPIAAFSVNSSFIKSFGKIGLLSLRSSTRISILKSWKNSWKIVQWRNCVSQKYSEILSKCLYKLYGKILMFLDREMGFGNEGRKLWPSQTAIFENNPILKTSWFSKN